MPLWRNFGGTYGKPFVVLLQTITGHEETTGELVGLLLDTIPLGTLFMQPTEEG